jgi:hypothetical protein
MRVLPSEAGTAIVIVFRACGGLGNQLFQYAAARNVSERLGVPLAAELSWFRHPPRNVTPRRLYLTEYRLPLTEMPRNLSWRLSALHRRFPSWSWRLLGVEPIIEGRSSPLNVRSSDRTACLEGYWQDESLILPIREILLSELQPQAPLDSIDAAVLSEIDSCESVSIHVRRGDYVSLPSAAKHHGTCSTAYYERAFRSLASRVHNPRLFLFSDDLEWAMANLPSSWPIRAVGHSCEDRAVRDLRLMSSCRHHIIANSTFSWWGAWLGERPGSVVVAPSRWFAAERSQSRIVPSRWIRESNEP